MRKLARETNLPLVDVEEIRKKAKERFGIEARAAVERGSCCWLLPTCRRVAMKLGSPFEITYPV